MSRKQHLAQTKYLYDELILKRRFDKSSQKLKVLDASWYLPNENKNAFEIYQKQHLPSALFFDIDKVFASKDQKYASLPHMLPSVEEFEQEINKLGIENSDEICIYDQKGMFSACRAFMIFYLFGHDNVKILDGGLPKWREDGYPLDTPQNTFFDKLDMSSKSQYKVKEYRKDFIVDIEQIINIVNEEKPKEIIVDARSSERFYGKVDEARPGSRSGHIPNSLNVPFQWLLYEQDKTFRSNSEIKKIFESSIGLSLEQIQNENRNIVASCGSGVTASVLLFALRLLDFKNIKIYDGSWSEYGDEKNAEKCKVIKD